MNRPGDQPREWLIWSNEHGAWWGPQRSGYTTEVNHAGRYTFEEADEIARARLYRSGASANRLTGTPAEVAVPAPEHLPRLWLAKGFTQVKALNIRPGDVIVVEIGDRVSVEERESVVARARALNLKLLVFDAGARLAGVLRLDAPATPHGGHSTDPDLDSSCGE